MRQLVMVLMLFTILLGVNANENYATAGSEDIYFQPNSIEEQSSDVEAPDADYDADDSDYYEEPQQEQEPEQEPEQQQKEEQLGDNLDGIGEDAESCEYSCPRYYRPICVRRNGILITYATPCEYHNQLRCANVAKRTDPGQEHAITFELMHNAACPT